MDLEKVFLTFKGNGVPPTPTRRSLKSFVLPSVLISLSLVSLYYRYKPSYSIATRQESLEGYFDQFVTGAPLRHSEWLDQFLQIPSNESAKRVSKSFTRQTHIAGTRGDQLSALRVKHEWERLLLGSNRNDDDNVFDAGTRSDRQALFGTSSSSRPRVWVSTYYPYLNYPLSRSLSLTVPNSSAPSFVASLTEDVFPPDQDPTSSKGVPTFHGFSKSATIDLAHKAKLVYAGRGTKRDFERLQHEGVQVRGNVVIVQYGGSFRGLKVKAAEEAGAVACIIYSDPAADGEITQENGYEPYPFGPARAPSSVQRGSVQYLSIRPGDPLTPSVPAYNPSLARAPRRLPLNSTNLPIPSIPSLPISYRDAIPLLKSLNGRGQKRRDDEEGDGWKEGGLRYKGVEYWTGPGLEHVQLVNEMEDKVTKIWNTMAIIPGQVKDEIVVIGNHNDAWTFGAGDPNSGTSSMHETIKGISYLLSRGWKPFRTILLASWDAEEFGLIGSTEFGEDFTDYLRERVVAYLNLDVSVSGSSFDLAASPSLANLLQECSGMVRDPTAAAVTLTNTTTTTDKELRFGEGGGNLGNTKVSTLGSGSDFSVFLQYIGVAAGNLGFSPGPGDPVYHYHSNYDSFTWMERFGDPTFERHVVVSKILGLTALRLTQDLVLPLNTTAYSLELEKYLEKVVRLPSYPGIDQVDLTVLGSKLSQLVQVSQTLDERARQLVEELGALHHDRPKDSNDADFDCLHHRHHPRHRHHDRDKKDKRRVVEILKAIRAINRRKQSFESTLLVPSGTPGLVGREWYKSLVVAPGRWLGYGATTFPGLTEALELDRDVKQAVEEVDRLEKSIDRAIELLKL